jgi:FkbM family methyltransferase
MAMDIRAGRFREPELDLVGVAVHIGETALDLGANYGMYTYPLDRAVGSTGHVYAFEPLPFTSAVLRRVGRLLRFRRVDIVTKGCGERAGTLSFTVPVQDSGAISAGQAHFSSRQDDRPDKEVHVRWPAHEEVTCEVVALDQFLPDLEHLSFVKCDIEGAELFAFRGGRRLIERHHPTVLVEINPWFLEGFGQTVDELVGFFAERGYRLYRYDDTLRELIEEPAERVVEDNYVFVHPDREDRLTSFVLRPLPVG